jgi:hypothetical protein
MFAALPSLSSSVLLLWAYKPTTPSGSHKTQCEPISTPAHGPLETTGDSHAERKYDGVKAIFGTAFTFVANHMKGMEKASYFTITPRVNQVSSRGSRLICTERENVELHSPYCDLQLPLK